MKTKLALLLISLSALSAHARCVVEILDESHEPLGHIFQGDSCAEPRSRCQKQLARLNVPGASCIVTYDIGSKNEARPAQDQ